MLWRIRPMQRERAQAQTLQVCTHVTILCADAYADSYCCSHTCHPCVTAKLSGLNQIMS